MVTTLIVALAVQLNLYNNTPYDAMPGTVPQHPDHFDSLFLQLKDWARFVLEDLTHPWSWKSPRSEYDTHLWTIPIQFRSSMIIFLALIGLARTRPQIRTTLLLILWLYSLQQHRWEVALFFAGMALAERSLATIETQQKNLIPRYGPVTIPATPMLRGIWKKAIWRSLFMTGLYFGSFPRAKNVGSEMPGFLWMSSLIESPRYWQSFGATLLVWATSNDVLLQSLFISPLLRYLADISFSLYLVHGPVLHIFGYSLVPSFLSLTGKDTALQYQLGVLLALLFLTPIVLWVADVFWRVVDKPCATFVGHVAKFCFIEIR